MFHKIIKITYSEKVKEVGAFLNPPNDDGVYLVTIRWWYMDDEENNTYDSITRDISFTDIELAMAYIKLLGPASLREFIEAIHPPVLPE